MGNPVAAGRIIEPHPFTLPGGFVQNGEHPVTVDLVNPLKLKLLFLLGFGGAGIPGGLFAGVEI